MRRLVAAVCLAVAPAVALAVIYKVQMPDGTILYTDAPPPGGKILEERQSATPARPAPKTEGPATGSDRPVVNVLPSPPARPPAGPTGPTSIRMDLDAAVAEVSAAERDLAVARRRLELGREPQPGERLGTATGGSRLSPEYEKRIAHLEGEVAAAEARVKRAYEMRNALR